MSDEPGAHPESVQRDPRTYLRVLWRWKLLFLVIVVAVPAAAMLLRGDPPPATYESTVLMQIQTAVVDTSLVEGSFSRSQSLAATARLIRTTAVAKDAAALLDPPPDDPRSLLNQIRVEPDEEAGFISITATAFQASRAQEIADAFGNAVVTSRVEQAVQELNRTITGIKDQLDDLKRDDDIGRLQLSEQLQRLRTVRAAQGSNAEIVEPALPATLVATSGARRTLILGIVVGLLLAIGAVVGAESFDRRIRTPGELEEFTGLPLLSAIPPEAFTASRSNSPRADEAFHMLRGALTYFNVDSRMASVVVTSAGQQDGKTTVATQLALALARAGKRVILVDADLRRPQACVRLGIVEPGLGLGDVLVGEAALNDVLVSFPIAQEFGVGALLVLPAGAPPPNPSELMSSRVMVRLMQSLERQADIVIIDTPAALAVSDALPLLQAGSGAVLVARMDRSTREAVSRLQRVVTKADGEFLGTVATGVTSGNRYTGYEYEIYRSANGNAAGRRVRDLLPGSGRRRERTAQRTVSRS
ncbi:MAG: polysaccharide biosynthesis tyrosine autokinase [Solirubrobacteraceae bacterium]